jgi:hypothetical protein
LLDRIADDLNSAELTIELGASTICLMPRPRREDQLQRTLDLIISGAAAEIAQAVRQNIADEVSRMVSGGRRASVAGRIARKRRVILCPVPNCGKPGGGPKWGWFCGEHKDLPAAEKKKAREATRAHAAKSTPKKK